MSNYENTVAKSGNYTYNTAGTFVDRNIIVKVPKAIESVSGSVATTIDSVSITKSGSSYAVSGSNSNTGTATVTVSTKGFTDSNSYSGSVTGSASVSATIDKATLGTSLSGDDISISTVTVGTSTTPNYHTVSGSGSTNISSTATVSTDGYVTTDDSNSGSTKTVSATVSADIADATVSVSATKPTGYTENTTAVVPSGGYLVLNEGYMPNTTISLATLVPEIEPGNVGASSDVLQGKQFYDSDGTVITGTIPTATSGTLNITDTSTAVTIDASGNVKASLSGNIKPSANSYVTSASGISGTDSTVKVGTVTIGSVTNNTSGGTSSGTINSGAQIKIGKGYYASDVYYQAQDASSTGAAVTTVSATATGVNTASSGSYYVTPKLTVDTAGYISAGKTGSKVYLATTSMSTPSFDATSSDASYTASVLSTAPASGPYVTFSTSTTATAKSVVTNSSVNTSRYLPIYDGSFTIS